MFVVLLEFSDNKPQAPRFMEGHQQWIARGVDDGVFSLVGSLQPNRGGAIVASGISRLDLEARVADDPFVAEGVVNPTILEIKPSKADPRLKFLVEGA